MNEITVVNNTKIEELIYEVRGKQVMIDADIASLYGCKNGTKTVNQSVSRNKDKFPENFCFRLTKEEYKEVLRSQIGTLELKRGKHNKYLPYAFTEEGVAMLATTIHTKIASEISIKIMKAFVTMRKFISSNFLEQQFYKDMLLEHDNDIKLLKETFSKFDSISNEIFFDGEIYDAYSLLLNIINSANKNIIIIDNYLSKELLDLLSNTKKNIIIYSKNFNNALINKYNSQYHNVIFKIDTRFHDRFIIIDEKEVYHCGASFKDLGKKCFAISRITDSEIISNLLDRLNK